MSAFCFKDNVQQNVSRLLWGLCIYYITPYIPSPQRSTMSKYCRHAKLTVISLSQRTATFDPNLT